MCRVNEGDADLRAGRMMSTEEVLSVIEKQRASRGINSLASETSGSDSIFWRCGSAVPGARLLPAHRDGPLLLGNQIVRW